MIAQAQSLLQAEPTISIRAMARKLGVGQKKIMEWRDAGLLKFKPQRSTWCGYGKMGVRNG